MKMVRRHICLLKKGDVNIYKVYWNAIVLLMNKSGILNLSIKLYLSEMSMKKCMMLFGLLISVIYADEIVDTSNFVLIDQIEVVVYGQEEVEIITKSDIDRPSLGGGFRTKEDIVFEREVLLD